MPLPITTADLLSEIQRHLIEDVNGGTSWVSGQWTALEVLNYLTRRFTQFLKDSKIVTERTTAVTLPAVQRYPLPQDWIMSLRAAWRSDDMDTLAFNELPRADSWEEDHFDPSHQTTSGIPAAYTDGENPPPQIWFFPGPSLPGEYQILYIALPSGFDPVNSFFTPLSDEFVTAIKWGVLADMLGKVGRSQDVRRAAYAQARYDEGVQMARLILQGMPT